MTTETTAPSRLEHIQSLRGLAALMVMLSHLYIIDQKYNTHPLLPEGLLFGMAGVDIFFVISGFIMVYITSKWTPPSIKRVPEFLFARITRIYPLYWLVSAALLIVYLIRPDMVFSSSPGEPNLIKSFLLFPDKTFPLLEVGWTLIHEIGFYIIFAGLLILRKSLRLWGLLIWASFIIITASAGLNNISVFTRYMLSPLTLEFIAGGIVGWLFIKAPARIFPWIAILVILSCLVAIGAYYMIGDQDLFFRHWTRTLIFTVPASLIVMLMALRDKSGKACPKTFVTLGDWSYALYLTHILTLSLLGRIWARLGIDNPLLGFIAIILMSIVTIAVAGLTYKLFEHPALLLSKRVRQKIFS